MTCVCEVCATYSDSGSGEGNGFLAMVITNGKSQALEYSDIDIAHSCIRGEQRKGLNETLASSHKMLAVR